MIASDCSEVIPTLAVFNATASDIPANCSAVDASMPSIADIASVFDEIAIACSFVIPTFPVFTTIAAA